MEGKWNYKEGVGDFFIASNGDELFFAGYRGDSEPIFRNSRTGELVPQSEIDFGRGNSFPRM